MKSMKNKKNKRFIHVFLVANYSGSNVRGYR